MREGKTEGIGYPYATRFSRPREENFIYERL